MFTLYELENIPTELPKGCKYMIYQKEMCPETGRLHYQGYVELDKPTRINAVKRLFGGNGMHLDKRRGTQEEAIFYCSKDESKVGPTMVFGEPSKQGNRTDVENAIHILKNGGKLLNILDENPSLYIRSYKGLQAASTLMIKQRLGKIILGFEVVVLYGPTGTGKTHTATMWTEDVYKIPAYDRTKLWFDGYDGEQTIVLDEFHGQLEFNTLKQLLDKYVLQWPVKGSFIYSQWKTVIVCSNKHPQEWYPDHSIEEWQQLERRITTLKEMSVPYRDTSGRSSQVILTANDIVPLVLDDDSDAKTIPLFEVDDQEPPEIIEVPNNQLELFGDDDFIVNETWKPRILKKRKKSKYLD